MKIKKNLISICITAYNVEKYIVQCLDSIIKYENNISKEIIIINDCSNDNTENVINLWISQHPQEKINYIKNNTNLGQVKSLIKAVNVTNGEYLTFMDADDFFYNSTLKNKLNLFFNNQNLKVIYGNGIFYENGKYYGNVHKNIIPIFKKGYLEVKKYINSHTPMLSLSTILIKKEFFINIGGFDDTGKSNDWITNIRIFNNINNNNEFYIDKTFAFGYRMHNNNISKNPNFQLSLLLHVIENHCDPKYYRGNISNAYFITSLRYLLINNLNKGIHNMKFSIKNKFSLLKIIIFIVLMITPKKIIYKFNIFFYKLKSLILKYFQ